MTTRVRRTRRARWIGSLGFAVVLAGCGAGVATPAPAATAAPSVVPTAPVPAPTLATAGDRSIDVGDGVSLHVRCTAGTGPTVLLDADLNGDMSEYDLVIPRLPSTVHACAIDRAGEGSSSRPAKPGRSSADIAHELHALAAAAGIPRPYVLVGNHFGGLFDLRYAALYPQDVSGLVLLDPFLPTAFMRFHAGCTGISTEPNNEGLDLCAMLTEAASASLKPPDVPLIVVTSADNPGWSAAEFDLWLQSHRDLVASVRLGRQVIVHSELVIPREQPDVTTKAIEDVLNAASHPQAGWPSPSG